MAIKKYSLNNCMPKYNSILHCTPNINFFYHLNYIIVPWELQA